MVAWCRGRGDPFFRLYIMLFRLSFLLLRAVRR
jgi:hypothetical protein